MIRFEDVFSIGKIIKPHGIEGEMQFEFTTDVFDTENAEYLIFDIDGILVPFFIESYRFNSDKSAFIFFEDIDSDEKARRFSGKTVYLENAFLDKVETEVVSINYFVGFSVVDTQAGRIGELVDVDESTQNTLFVVKNEANEEILIPANDDFVEKIEHETKTIFLNLPEGLLDI